MPKFQPMRFFITDTETDGRNHVIDIGGTLINRQGVILDRISFLIKDNYDRYGPYYAAKRPIYEEMLSRGLIIPVRFSYARKTINAITSDPNVHVWAYNAAFDERALNTTTRIFKMGEEFSPDKKWNCIWKAVAACKDAGYLDNFPDHKEITESGKFYKSSAQSVFRHFFADTFIEDHTASADSKIEAAILIWLVFMVGSASKLMKMVDEYRGSPYRSFPVEDFAKIGQSVDAANTVLDQLAAL